MQRHPDIERHPQTTSYAPVTGLMTRPRSWSFERLFCAFMLAFVAVASVGTASAFESRSAESVRVGADETIDDDLYAAGATVLIEGTVTGDVVAAGRRVTVTGSVGGDLIAAGQTVEIDGRLADDARITGQTLTVREGAQVEGHMVAAGYHLELEEGSAIASDLAFMGRSVRHRGEIAGNATISAQAIVIDGSIEGDADLWTGTDGPEDVWWGWGWRMDIPDAMRGFGDFPGAGDAPILPEGIEIGDNARIGGDITVVSRAAPDVPPEAAAGEVTHTEVETEAEAAEQQSGFWERVRRFAALAVLGVVGLALVPSLVRGAGGRLRRTPWQGAGWGLLAVIAIPVAAILLLLAAALVAYLLDLAFLGGLGGAVVAAAVVTTIALIVLYALALVYVVQLVAGYAGGRWLLGRIAPDLADNGYAALIVGVALIVAFGTIPAVGELVGIAVALFGAGGLVLLARSNGAEEM